MLTIRVAVESFAVVSVLSTTRSFCLRSSSLSLEALSSSSRRTADVRLLSNSFKRFSIKSTWVDVAS